MTESENKRASFPWLNRKRSAAIGFGLGATLALSPFVWAENPPAAGSPPQSTQTTPQTMTSPIALIQHQSLAPLVKKVSPAVVNISVSRRADAAAMSEEPELAPSPGFPNSPFDQFLRRFFEQQGQGGQRHPFPQVPGNAAQRIALGSGFIIDPSGYVVTNSHVIGDAGKVEVTLQDNSQIHGKDCRS